MSKKRITALFLAVVMAVTMSSGFAYAESSTSKLNSVKQQISSVKSQLKAGEAKENQLVAQINSLNGQIEDLENKIAALEAEITATKGQIEEAERNLVLTQERIDVQNDSLGQRLRVMYKNGESSMFQILLGSSSISEFLTNLDMIQKIYNNDIDVLRQIQAQYEQIEIEKQNLEALKAQLSQQQQQQETQKNNLAAQKSSVEALKADVAKDNAALEAQIDKLNAEANQLTALIKQQQAAAQASSSTTSKYQGGSMLWPVPASHRISSPYGYRIHPILKVRKFHSGIDIPASTGTAIVAAADGTVIMSRYYGGYGKCLMIDHGGGRVTLYGHCSSLLVSQGQKVSKGQTVAKVGSTGQSTGPHLHFEVRINGSTTSPLSYVS